MHDKNRYYQLLLWLPPLLLIIEMVVFAFIDIRAVIALLLPFIMVVLWAANALWGPQPSWLPMPEKQEHPHQIFWKEVFTHSPMFTLVVDERGKIIWSNREFSEFFQAKAKSIKDLTAIIPEEEVKKLLTAQEVDEIKIDDIVLKPTVKPLQKSSKFRRQGLMALYLEDFTQVYEMAQKLDQERVVICYIQVDDFDEIMAASPEESRPELLVRIDKAITQWVQNYNGFVKKYETDKFVSVFTLKEFKLAQEMKFDILEEIKNIKIKPGISVTLSMGAAYWPGPLTEINRQAQNALELCLGRGGDQVVVITESKTYFYGGKTKEVEKYSRVRARVIAHALRDLVEESDIVMILGHLFLDMDALGAGVGLLAVANSLGKPGYIILPSGPNPSIESLLSLLMKDDQFKDGFLQEEPALSKITKKTLVVVADTHRPSLCLTQEILARAEKVVVIDHHRRSEEFIEKAHLVYLEPYASSTSEMVTEMLEYMGDEVKISPLAATSLLSGIVVDTRNFSFKTGVRTFEAASFLRRLGADPTTVYKLFQEEMETVNARAEVVKRAERVFDNIAISFYEEKPPNPTLSSAQAANALLEIKGIHASFVIVPTDEGVSISGRSLGGINVQRILEKLGGGGHMTVAGAQLKDATIEQATEKIKQAIREYKKEGETS